MRSPKPGIRVPPIFKTLSKIDCLMSFPFLKQTLLKSVSKKIKTLAFSFEKKDLVFFNPEKKMIPPCSDSTAWRKKAIAFVTRCHQHLFGKNNEDPLAYLFSRGFKNEFAKQMLIGWNKYNQERSMENWGFGPGLEKLFLPKGLVVPYIVEKELKSVFIHTFEDDCGKETHMVPGSLSSCMILQTGPDTSEHGKKEPPVLVHDLLEGLLFFQEKKGACIIIHPDLETPLDKDDQRNGEKRRVVGKA